MIGAALLCKIMAHKWMRPRRGEPAGVLICRRCGATREVKRRLVYNKATRTIDVVQADGTVTDSFAPPQERL